MFIYIFKSVNPVHILSFYLRHCAVPSAWKKYENLLNVHQRTAIQYRGTSVMMFGSDSILGRRLYKYISAGFLLDSVFAFEMSEVWTKTSM